MEEINELEMEMDLRYITERRDKTLKSFNEKIKLNLYNREAITAAFDGLLRVNKQVKMLEDAAKVIKEK